MAADFKEDPYQHIKSITIDVPPGVRFGGGTQFGPGLLAWPASSVMSVSYWYRTFSNQSGNTFAETDTIDEQAYVEFFGSGPGGDNGVAVLLSEDPFPEDEEEEEDGGQLQFSTATGAAYGQWHHVAYACSTAGGSGAKTVMMMLDGAPNLVIQRDAGRGFLLPFAGFNYVLGSDSFGAFTTVDISELWVATGQLVGFNNPAILQKFRSAGGSPVPLGEHGELPTGTPPVIFGHGDANAFLQPNLGTGGNLALSGGLITIDGPP